ncbi:MAG: phosphate ABC transporter permease PstA [Chloroflexota bacterium]|nr:phosphate ABC transporter permease PstA [Candidatus Limnocylindria bacterium]
MILGSLGRARVYDRLFAGLCLGATALAIGILALLLVKIFADGVPTLTLSFLTSYPSRFPAEAGIRAAILGTLWLIGLTAAIAVPTGIAAAVWLEEYAPRNNFLARLIETNIANLAGVPSIIYGLLGLGLFVRILQLERSVIAGALTMSLLVLPIIVISGREALRAVPRSQRDAAYAMGATRSQVVSRIVLPAAYGGTLTGVILALSRAIGETAPLITIGALTFIAFDPDGLLSPFTVLPIQIFNWISRPQSGFHDIAASAIVVLIVTLLFMNALAVVVRDRAQRRLRG